MKLKDWKPLEVVPVTREDGKYAIYCYHTGEKDLNNYSEHFRDMLDKQEANGGYLWGSDVQSVFGDIPFDDGWNVGEVIEE
jgi:hypothetical protein